MGPRKVNQKLTFLRRTPHPTSTKLKNPGSSRDVTEIGPGDYVKIGSQWERVRANSAHGADRLPKSWTVTTENGSHGMFGINRYAKSDDFE